MKIARRLSLLLTLSALLVPAAAARAASIWTPVASGTTDTISAVVYQSPTRFWYATTNGRIAYWNGSAFVAGTGVPPGEIFTDLAFQPGAPGDPGAGGAEGYAVASNGDVWRTADGGVSWTQLAHPNTYADCGSGETAAPESELNAVVWADNVTAYLLGNNSTLLKSTAANTPTPSFTEINKANNGTCQAQSQPSAENLTDAVFLLSNPPHGFMIDQSFGRLFSTSNGFATGTPLNTVINNYQGNPRIALDAANPNRIWAVDHNAGGTDCGTLCFGYTTDGGQTFTNPSYPQYSSSGGNPPLGLYDVSSRGGVEVAAGTGGTILNSIDGLKFYNQPAGGALATEDWRAEDAYDAAHAAVGGVGGALAVTAAANTIPGTAPPTGPGPATPPSGSSPKSFSTGGATVTIYRVVTVSGRAGRYVPVAVSTKLGRKVAVTIASIKGKHRLSAAHLTLAHGGARTIHVTLSSKVKPGKYSIVIRISNLKGHGVGRKVTLAFKLV